MTEKKLRARIVLPVWGRNYLDEMINFSLPSALAPGNLPELANLIDCEFAIVTESTLFSRIRRSHAYQEIRKICPTHLVPLDDLVATRHHYGMTLTFAYCRGFEDLGAAMTDTYLIFLNSDFILANGSWKNLGKKILAGESLVMAPSYCATRESVEPILETHKRRSKNGRISLSQRKMAELIIPHRHLTIRGKTVNQRLFSMDRLDQFYWYVDEHTLVAHQLPIAVVCLKPEHANLPMRSYWDYGLISELAPNTRPFVFTDSDDFLMLELRSEAMYGSAISPGWPTQDEIAKDLASFTTYDHRKYGRYSLVVHSKDIPANLAQERSRLRRFVDKILDLIPDEPVPHIGHPYWHYSYSEFDIARKLWNDLNRDGFHQDGPILGLRPGGTPESQTEGTVSLVGRLYLFFMGKRPNLKRGHPQWADFRHANDTLKEVAPLKNKNALVLKSGNTTRLISQAITENESVNFLEMDLFYAQNSFFDVAVGPNLMFDLCVADMHMLDAQRFADIFTRLRPRLRSGSKVIAVFANSPPQKLAPRDPKFYRNAFPGTDVSRVTFSGSRLSATAHRLLRRGADIKETYGGIVGLAAFAFCGLMAIPIAFVANLSAGRSPVTRPPEFCSSMTIEIDIL